jgi:hypothetical protein
MSTFKTILIQDSRIANITDEETFAVADGPSQSSFQNFTATTQSASSIVFNIQIPSENIVIDRHLLMQSTITLDLTLSSSLIDGFNATPAPKSVLVFDYGLTDSLQAFPLNSLCTTQQMSINNATVSQNTKDILPMLLRMYDRRKLNRYNSLCPSLPDSFYSEYISGLGALNNVLSGYNNQSLDEDFVPRGAFPVQILNVIHSYQYNPGTGYQTVYDSSLVMIESTIYNKWEIVIQFTTTEPFICLPPWINTNSNNQAGLVGVNNLSCNFNIDSTCSRVFSTANKFISNIALGATSTAMTTPDLTSVETIEINGNDYTAYTTTTAGSSINAFQSSQLMFNFLSLQPEQYKKISSKNCVPYLDYPRYLSSQQSTVTIASKGSSTLTSQSLQLNQIPDLLLICVRKPMSTQNWSDPSAFLTINSISMSFNNTAGILSSANQQQLYNISYRNGSAQSFYEFAGTTRSNYTGAVDTNGDIYYSQELVGRGAIVGTTGSLLVLNPVYDFNLPSYLSNSSLGQYNLYFTINVTNQFSTAIANPEICVVTINSGIFTTQLGTSIINTGILTKEDVLRTKNQAPTLDTSDHRRFIGGNLSNMGMSNVLKLVKKHVKGFINDANGPTDEPIASSGAGMSGGSQSGGRISRLSKYTR